jgi:hypothetical protein
MDFAINPDKPVDLSEMLDALPMPNHAVRVEDKGDGALVLHVPIRQRWYNGPPLSWILPFRKERSIALDQLGREVWIACDGKRNVEAIVEAFARDHGVSFHEARLGVTEFLRSLTRRGLIIIVGRTKSE